jgi:PAS domain S-box-containing protein
MLGDDSGVARTDNSRFRAIFASSPECVKLIGPDYRLIDMNPAGLRMLDVDAIEMVRGHSVLDIVEPRYRDALQEAVDRVFRGESITIEFEAIGLRGRRLVMHQSGAPLFDPNDPSRVVEMIAVTRDITAQRHAEGELLRVRLAEELNKSKAQFLASVSHELRTPLDHIIGYTELLQEAARDQGRQQDAEDHQQVLDAATRLLYMVSQLLNISQTDLSQQAPRIDEWDVGALLHDAAEAMRPLNDLNGNRIVVSVDDVRTPILLDGKRLDQALRCLLSNAVKHTTSGVIEVRARTQKGADAEWLVLDVIDNGAGVDSAVRTALFEPVPKEGAAGGLGLGLAVARHLMRHIGGEALLVQSDAGKGSHFALRAPIAPSVPAAA